MSLGGTTVGRKNPRGREREREKVEEAQGKRGGEEIGCTNRTGEEIACGFFLLTQTLSADKMMQTEHTTHLHALVF